MRKICCFIAFVAMASLSVTSCKDKKKTDDIIVDKIVPKPQNGPESMSSSEVNGSAAWIDGKPYAYTITRSADDSLAVVENHGKKYHDNKIMLVVSRPDGTEFFRKTFTKKNFEQLLPEQFRETGVLVDMRFDKVEVKRMKFVANIGSPDETNDEFYLVTMVLDNFGHTSAEKYSASAESEVGD